jgi:hypothetical protein
MLCTVRVCRSCPTHSLDPPPSRTSNTYNTPTHNAQMNDITPHHLASRPLYVCVICSLVVLPGLCDRPPPLLVCVYPVASPP